MEEYPKNIKFKYTWRKYQQRVLDELQNSMLDKCLHVVAPPGSGKTVLGLEVALRINKPTLILAPTITIQNQWIQRFCELFLQVEQPPSWISRDIRNPQFMTVVTYQGLHSACGNRSVRDETISYEESSFKEIVNRLKSCNIKTIVVDEAHHLRNEWWKTLSKVVKMLNPVVVGLTATPPYDVSYHEWERYVGLVGAVDAEISIPELIIEGDLCPHQDYIYLTLPEEKEAEHILKLKQNINKTFQDIKGKESIIRAIEAHPVWQNPESHLEWIYENLSVYSAFIIFLHDSQREIPQIHLKITGNKEKDIPKLNFEWAEILLDFYLYGDKEHFMKFEQERIELENKLKRSGVIERKQVRLVHNKRVSNILSSSVNKLNGINSTVDFEYNQLGKELRMVILTDYIHSEFLVMDAVNDLNIDKLGAIPVFEKLRRKNRNHKKIGVLTGSIVIIPCSAFLAFEKRAVEKGITKIGTTPVPFDGDYLLIQQNEQIKNDIVQIVTHIFQDGEIEVLIGTKSLLGEGWDAPCINSLVLASFVGSFVLSNQMRGRAIRVQNGNLNKTSNIWHLACVDTTISSGGEDIELLRRRFKSFVGVSFTNIPVIENGIGRFDLPINISSAQDIEEINAKMFLFAGERDELKMRWMDALGRGVALVEEIKIPFPQNKSVEEIQGLYLTKTISYLVSSLLFGVASFSQEVLELLLRCSRYMKNYYDLYYFLVISLLIGCLFFGRKTYKALRLYLRYRDISKDIHQIGEALLESLIKANVIQSADELEVETVADETGAVFCCLKGGSSFEKSTFINALIEIIEPIESPRYMIIRKSILLSYINQSDYHAVPEVLGKNKRLAEYFMFRWKDLVGRCELIYTRTIEGRRLLLKARMKLLSAQLNNHVEHMSKWK